MDGGNAPALPGLFFFSSNVLRDLSCLCLAACHHLLSKKGTEDTFRALAGNSALNGQWLSWRLKVERRYPEVCLLPAQPPALPRSSSELKVSVATGKGRGWEETGTAPRHPGSKYSRGYKRSPGLAGQAAILKAGAWSRALR